MKHDEVRTWLEEQGFSVRKYRHWSNYACKLALNNYDDAEPLMNMFQLLFGDEVHMNDTERRHPALLRKSQSMFGMGLFLVWVPEGNTNGVYILDTARIGELFGDSDEQ